LKIKPPGKSPLKADSTEARSIFSLNMMVKADCSGMRLPTGGSVSTMVGGKGRGVALGVAAGKRPGAGGRPRLQASETSIKKKIAICHFGNRRIILASFR
jgi:hypothetical protein